MRQIIKRILTWLMGMIRQNARHTFWKRGITEKQAIARGVRRFFQQNYELRYNVMKLTEEFRPKNVTAAREKIPASREKIPASRENVTAARDGWQQLTDRDLRRIAIEQMDQVGVGAAASGTARPTISTSWHAAYPPPMPNGRCCFDAGCWQRWRSGWR